MKLSPSEIRTLLLYEFKRPLFHRDCLPVLASLLDLNGKAVEIGVETGDYSEVILKNGRFSTVYSIDSWLEFDREVYKDMNNVPQKEQDKRYRFVLKRLRKFGKKSSVLRVVSEQASVLFKDDTLDFIYVDANHSYGACKKDIELWWPKLREGGIFAGHDFLDGKLPTGNFGVKSAVEEFMKRNEQEVFVIPDQWPSWYLVKRIKIK